MDVGLVAAFALASFLLVVVPGPSVLFVVGRALALGRRAALLTVAGNAAGVYVLALAVAIGLGPLLARSATLLLVVKLLGAAYLALLGVQALRRPDPVSPSDVTVGPPTTAPALRHARLLREGAVVGLLNPKALVFFVAVLPQFVRADAAVTVPAQLAVLGAVFVVVALLSDSAWGVLAGVARRWFARDARRLVRVERAGGALLVGLGGGLAVEAATR